MFKNLTLRQKLLLVSLSFGACFFLLTGYFTWQLRSQILEDRKELLTSTVQAAAAVARGYEALAQAGQLSPLEAQEGARRALRAIRFGGADGKANYVYAWSLDGAGVVHPIKPEWEGQPMLGKVLDGEGHDVVAALLAGAKSSASGAAFVPTMFARPGQTVPVPKLQYVIRIEGWNWIVGAGLYMDDVDAVVRAQVVKGLVVAVLLIVLCAGGSALSFRVVREQLGGDPGLAVTAMRRLAQGDLSSEVPDVPSNSLLGELNAATRSLRDTVQAVRGSTESIRTASSEIAAGSTDLSQRTERSASSLQQTASSMEQLTSGVAQTSNAASTANQLASAASAAAQQGGRLVEQVVQTMGSIEQSARRIGDIIGVIDGIAFQTNILALNAAVEAARAGEQGKGFAVVASEVRSLAQRSAAAAKEVKSLITASVETTDEGAALVGQAGTAMANIVGQVQKVTDIVGEIAAAAKEQAAGIREVNGAVTALDHVTQQNAALVEESSAAAESLLEQSKALAEVVARFQLA